MKPDYSAILKAFNIPAMAQADVDEVVQTTIEYAKKRNAGAAEAACVRSLADTVSRHTFPANGQNVSLPEASRLLNALLKCYFANNYETPPQALEEATTQECLKTLLRLVSGKDHYDFDTQDIGLKVFPGQELCLAYHGNADNDMLEDCKRKWIANGGNIYDGRMIALIKDPIWSRMSIFGLPYPPFDFRCPFGVIGVSRKDCISLGLIHDNQSLLRTRKPFKLKLSIRIK